MLIAQPAFPHYVDTDGSPITAGSLYYGTVGANPRTSPVAVYWDAAGTQPAPQPIRTVAGYPVRNGAPANVYVGSAYSVALYNAAGELVFYGPDSAAFDAVLSGTTVYSRQILSADDAAEARTILDVPSTSEALLKTGGTMTGNVVLDGDATLALHPVTKQQFDAQVVGKNRVINGTFALNQRAFAGGSRTAGQYGHDRWKAGSGGATYTVVGETATITVGTLQQVIEGVNVPEGGTYTLSWSGTAQAKVDSGSYAASPITVTGKTAGTNITIEFGTGTVTKVQFESGASATTFERRLYSQDLAASQRYYLAMTGRVMSVSGVAGSSGQYSFSHIHLPVEMRAAPTVGYGITSNTNVSSAVPQDSSKWGCTLTITAAASGQFAINFTTLSFDAEL